MRIVDAHLDLAYNVTRRRDPRMPARNQPAAGSEIATVGLPDLRDGNVDLICATIFCMPAEAGETGGYSNAEEARAQALSQLSWYRQLEAEGLLQLVRSGTGGPPVNSSDDKDHGRAARATTSAIILLEGADALRSPSDVQEFFDAGVRIVGLAWKRTRYAGGTGAPGPITDAGRDLIPELDRFGIIHDASHLAEESFFQILDLTAGPLIASHSNCRAIVGEGDRHLSDDMIRAIVKRGGVIGINFFDKFLLPKSEYGKRRATLMDVVAHIRHICDLAGNANHVGLGTDMDGGLGRNEIPIEIETSAELPRVADSLHEGGFNDSDVRAIIGENWRAFFRANLRSG